MHGLIESLRARIRAARGGGDDGMSLAELLVAMTLSVLVGAMTLSTFVGIDSAASSTVDRTVASSSARAALLAWTDYLRVADGLTPGDARSRIVWMTTSDLAFYADLGNRDSSSTATGVPTLVWLRRDATGTLMEQLFVNGAQTACRAMVNGTSSAVALFSATDAAGQAITLSTTADTSTGCASLPTAVGHAGVSTTLQGVAAVTVDFVVPDTRGAHPLEFTSQATFGGGTTS